MDEARLLERLQALEARIRRITLDTVTDDDGTTHGCTHGCTGSCPDTGNCTYGCTYGCTNGCATDASAAPMREDPTHA